MEQRITAGHDVLLTGDESWPAHGDHFTKTKVDEIIKEMAGLKRYWNCLEKAVLINKMYGYQIVIGDLTIYSHKMESSYGFKFIPPLEFHAWNVTDNLITIDFGLPGCIEIGSILKDEYGPYLVNRKPIIMASKKIPKWIKYEVKQFIWV